MAAIGVGGADAVDVMAGEMSRRAAKQHTTTTSASLHGRDTISTS